MAGRERWGAIELTRERGDSDFDARELRLLRRIVAHVGAGLRASALLSAAPLAASDGDGTPGVLIFDRRGRVVQLTQAAKRYLEELEDLGPRWQEDGSLPEVVWMALGALRGTLVPQTDRDRVRVPLLCAKSRSGR